MKETFLSVSTLPMNEQREALEKCINEWKADKEQIDDMLVIGVRVG